MLFCQQHFKVTAGLKAGRANQIDFVKFSAHKTCRSSRPRACGSDGNQEGLGAATYGFPLLVTPVLKNEAYRITERQC